MFDNHSPIVFFDFLLKAISRYIFLEDNVWDDSCMFRKLLLHFS